MNTTNDQIIAAKENSGRWQEAIYKEAIRLADFGYSIVPLRKMTKILPPKKYNIGYYSASKNQGTLKKWFAPGTGKFSGWNIGIVCGKDGGAFVLDVDRHGDIDGTESLKSLEQKYGKIEEKGPIQKTPGGGLHFLFSWETGAVSTSGKIAPGIDTRGGDADAFRSHIVVYPSVIVNNEGEAGQYNWLKSPYMIEYLPLAPNWAVTGSGQSERHQMGRGNELVETSDLEILVPIDQIERMLSAIDPDDLAYDDWLQVGQSINSQHCGDEGLALWDEWSRRGQRYKPTECTDRWKGFNPLGKVRIGTLFYLAKKVGWMPSEKDKYHSVPDEILYEINRIYPLVTISNKVRMVKFGTGGTINVLHPNDVRMLYQNRLVELEVAGGIILRNPVDIWLGWKHRMAYEGMGFYPFPLDCPLNHLNLWRGFAVEPEEGDTQIFTDFVREVICRGNDEHANWLLDWIAQIFQKPGEKLGTAVVLRGSEGTGKNTLTRALSKLLKPANYTHMVNPKHFMSNFNSYILQSLLCVLNEAVWSGNHREANLLKGLITEDFVSIEMKGIDTFNAVNCVRLIIMTNETRAVPAGNQSRRYFVLQVSDERKGDTEYWDELHNCIDDHAPQLLWYFLNREIKHDLRYALETSELWKQRELTAASDSTSADEVAHHLVVNGYAEIAPEGSKLAGKFVWTNEFLKQICLQLKPYAAVSQQFPRAIGRLFEEQGYTLRTDRARDTGRLFLLPDTPEPLLECLSKKFSIPIPELEGASVWTEKKNTDRIGEL